MAKKLKVGDRIQKYRITKVFGPGAMAISYAAATDAGVPVFFKQYKSPAVTVEWYREYVRYQKELNRRIAESAARNYCVRALEAFEAVWGGRNYFQVFELIQNGEDLGGIFETEAAAAGTHAMPVPFPARLWEQHLIWSKVFMSGINSLHAAKIAHTDLKPDNAFLIEDPSIGAGYQLKLIDLDFSVLTDQAAPWHGKQGYVGTDNYRSPEHFTPGATPGAASDVFTCGLILYQLLAGRHPYWSEDQDEYAKKVMSYSAPRPVLGGTVPAPASNAAIAEIIYRCLAPKPGDRPTAAEVRDVLTGRAGAAPTATTTAASRKPMTTTPDDAGSTPAPAGTAATPADGTLSPIAPIDPTAAPDVAASDDAALPAPVEAPPVDTAPPVDAGLGEPALADAAPADAAPVDAAPVDAAPADASAPLTDETLPFPDAPPAWSDEPAAPAAEAPMVTDAPEIAPIGIDAPASDAVPADAAPAADAGIVEAPVDTPPALVPAAAPAPAAPSGAPLRADRIQLTSESGHTISVGVRTPLGKHIVRQFGEDSVVWDTEQCTLERGADGSWQVVPKDGTTNETLLNGATITSAQPLHEGDVIAVGRMAKGISKLPLTVRSA